jgi:hypothetical protein
MQVSVVQFRPWAPPLFQASDIGRFFKILSHSRKKWDMQVNICCHWCERWFSKFGKSTMLASVILSLLDLEFKRAT